MNIKSYLLTALVVILAYAPLNAQQAASQAPQTSPQPSQPLQETQTEQISYVPRFFGAFKIKFEASLYDGESRFDVRHSRLGVMGNASADIRYQMQIDFSNQGKITVLDSYAGYFKDKLEATIGQQLTHFSTDMSRGPANSLFANRSFLSKFLSTYHGTKASGNTVQDYTGTMGARDLGALARYRIGNGVPLRFSVGVFNGAGINNPEWSDRANVVLRMDAGNRLLGFSGAASYYDGTTPVDSRAYMDGGVVVEEPESQIIRMWDGELRYQGRNFLIEAEYGQRRLRDDQLSILSAAHVFGYYSVPISKKDKDMYLAPVARWDMGRNIEFIDSVTGTLDRIDAQRVTLGLNLGFGRKMFDSEIRLSGEKYFFAKKPGDYSQNHLFQDKITLEVVAVF